LRDNKRIALEIEDKIRAAHGLDFAMPDDIESDGGDDLVEV